MIAKEREVIKADVLVIGGGPAGLMAAIRASELGAKVVVAEKSNTLRSGSGGSGNDDFTCYIPEVHGKDTKLILKERAQSTTSTRFKNPKFANIWLEKSFEMVKLWDSWGIPMKYNGKWEFAGHALPGHPKLALKYGGGNQKIVLTKQVLKRGVRIMNRVTGFELLKDKDRIIGALGLDTWNDRVVEFEAKCVFLGTGTCSRLYPGITPGWMFNMGSSPFSTGDGRAMALRAGADLHNLEFTKRLAGPKYFLRGGKGTWIGVYRDPSGKPVGPFSTKPDREYGDVAGNIYTTMFQDYMASGRGPVYMDCKGASKDDIEYMVHWLRHEGNQGLLDHMAEENIDLMKNPIEFGTYEIRVSGGPWFTADATTSVKGLFVAGDENDASMANAVIWGWVAGENMARYAKDVEFGGLKSVNEQTEDKISLLNEILGRKVGADWEEANVALQPIMLEYNGLVRSETMLKQGLTNLTRLNEKARKTLMARNGHELGRCLEVLNLMDIGEAMIIAAKERKETRASHRRTDYPFTNPLLDKDILVRKVDGKLVTEWRERV